MLHKRIFMSLFGVIICAISVGIFKLASFGVDPFQSFMSGLSSVIPISFGTLYVIVNLLLLSFAFFMGPLITVFNEKCAVPFLSGGKNNK